MFDYNSGKQKASGNAPVNRSGVRRFRDDFGVEYLACNICFAAVEVTEDLVHQASCPFAGGGGQ